MDIVFFNGSCRRHILTALLANDSRHLLRCSLGHAAATRCFCFLFIIGALGCMWMGSGAAWGQESARTRKQSDPETLFLDMSKVNLGTITTEDDKKKYLYTIQLEKARITRKTLRMVYDNAYDLYRAGDYEGARELSRKILAIDPDFEDAAILQRAAIALKGSNRPWLSEHKLVENKFEEGMSFYRSGKLGEAARRWDEALKLSPNNLKARYWLNKVRGDIADDHFRRGQEFYREHKTREALDQWYAALALNPRYPRLVGLVGKVESELRKTEANDKLQTALKLYSQGQTDQALNILDQVLEVEPGDAKAQRLQSEIRLEMANQYVAQGRRLYGQRQFNAAIAQWKKAVDYGYDAAAAEAMIAKAKSQMRQEAEAKRQAEEEARRREDEAKNKAEQDAQKTHSAAPDDTVPASFGTTEENRRQALRHWQGGIIAFQENNFEKARDEWTLCKQLDPSNEDCITGLKRIDQQLGGP